MRKDWLSASRVVVYLLLAAGLFAELGYGQAGAKMISGLDGLTVPTPTASALAQARRRIDDGDVQVPLGEVLFFLVLRGLRERS